MAPSIWNFGPAEIPPSLNKRDCGSTFQQALMMSFCCPGTVLGYEDLAENGIIVVVKVAIIAHIYLGLMRRTLLSVSGRMK